jgi:hypothetical protein
MEQLQNKRGIYFTLPSNKASAYIYINKTGSLSPKKVVKSAISLMNSFTGRTAFYELE